MQIAVKETQLSIIQAIAFGAVLKHKFHSKHTPGCLSVREAKEAFPLAGLRIVIM